MNAIDVTTADFDAIVIRGSATRPVLVDFWAPWCAPCRALAPVLERVAAASPDRFTLAKLDTDQEPEIAARYSVRGIPNCKLFVGGQVVDEFTGAQPEAAVRAFLDRALPSPAAAFVAAARSFLAAGNLEGAASKIEHARALDPDGEDVLLTYADVLLALGRTADAEEAVARLEAPERQRAWPTRDPRRLAAVKARIALSGNASADLAKLAQDARRDPHDVAARLAYARALAAAGDYERALPELIAVVRTDRKYGDDAGRRTMLAIFDALPADSELARRYRRELASTLN